ncbi:hypothetical protein [Aeromonas caviae]|uniref:hypothetical protein n=1 Tax=Aeromonas caviae TaxID=648 RepID=UPI002250497A|nr:hypothetical protein [Aeromonas caviae]MCX4071906.1 hypothetical protein [Aeromonas caviae]
MTDIVFAKGTPDSVVDEVLGRMKTYKPYKRKKIYGVGINDADYPTTHKLKNGKTWSCPLYSRWSDMLRRCYSPKSLANFASYKGCYVDDQWHSFMNFRKWMLNQDWDSGMFLDKDYLSGVVYGPDTCVLVPREVNNFLTDHASARGEWPIGVHFDKGQFVATINDGSQRIYLGMYADPHTAHLAWKAAKCKLACQLADTKNVDDRVKHVLRTMFK